MKKLLITLPLSLLCIAISTVFLINKTSADVPDEQIKEVTHLLDFIKNSHCHFNRNGSTHLAKETIKHIEKKYQYFRDDIENSEDFIKYSATKSTMSGRYYTVTCPGQQTIRSRDWLLKELEHFRMATQKTN